MFLESMHLGVYKNYPDEDNVKLPGQHCVILGNVITKWPSVE